MTNNGRFVSTKTVAERLLDNSRVVTATGCRVWVKFVRPSGYGYIKVRGKHFGVHRIAWELANEQAVPDGLCVCHRCDVPTCINPEHLFVATQAQNNNDRHAKKRDRTAKGETNSMAKLTTDQVVLIRSDGRSFSEIGRHYGISPAQARRIKLRLRWSHV